MTSPTLIARGYALDEVPCRCPAFSRFLSVKPPYRCDACGRLVDFKAPKNLPPGIVPPYRCLPPRTTPGAFDFTPCLCDPCREPEVKTEKKKKQSNLANYLENLIKGLSDSPSPVIASDTEPSTTRHSDRRNRGLFESEDPYEGLYRSTRKRTARSPLTSSSRSSNRRFMEEVSPGPYMDLERHNQAQRTATMRAWSRYRRNEPKFRSSRKSQVSIRTSRHEFCTRSPSVMTRASSANSIQSSTSRNPLYTWRRPGSPELQPGVGYFRRFRPGQNSEFRLDELPYRPSYKASSTSRPSYRPVREKRSKKKQTSNLRFNSTRVPWNPFFRNNYMQMSSVQNMRDSTERLYGTNTYLGGHKVLPI